jgi:hypothetical protein
MSDTRPFRRKSKLWLLETRAFQRLFARLSTSRKDAAACVSLSFLNDVKELRTHQRSQKPDTADEEFRPPCGEPSTTRRLHREAMRGRQRPKAPSPQCMGLYDLPHRSVKRLVVVFLHMPRKLRKTATFAALLA